MDGFNPFNDQPPEPEEQISQDENLTYALRAKDEWDLAKKYWEQRKEYFAKALALEMADYEKTRDPTKVGEIYMVAHQLELEAQAFINWVENIADEVERKRKRKKT